MKLLKVTTLALFALTPSLALACPKSEQAASCKPGMTWDHDTATCVEGTMS